MVVHVTCWCKHCVAEGKQEVRPKTQQKHACVPRAENAPSYAVQLWRTQYPEEAAACDRDALEAQRRHARVRRRYSSPPLRPPPVFGAAAERGVKGAFLRRVSLPARAGGACTPRGDIGRERTGPHCAKG